MVCVRIEVPLARASLLKRLIFVHVYESQISIDTCKSAALYSPTLDLALLEPRLS